MGSAPPRAPLVLGRKRISIVHVPWPTTGTFAQVSFETMNSDALVLSTARGPESRSPSFVTVHVNWLVGLVRVQTNTATG